MSINHVKLIYFIKGFTYLILYINYKILMFFILHGTFQKLLVCFHKAVFCSFFLAKPFYLRWQQIYLYQTFELSSQDFNDSTSFFVQAYASSICGEKRGIHSTHFLLLSLLKLLTSVYSHSKLEHLKCWNNNFSLWKWNIFINHGV